MEEWNDLKPVTGRVLLGQKNWTNTGKQDPCYNVLLTQSVATPSLGAAHATPERNINIRDDGQGSL